MQDKKFKIVAQTIGSLLCLESLFMVIPLLVALCSKGEDVWAFGSTIGITLAVGLLFKVVGRSRSPKMGKKEGYFIVATTWIFFSLFGMLPFMFSGYIPSATDAFFETMSGFTTTGSTILTDIESLPAGLLFWRSMIQWIGGMGIILFTLAVLPTLNSGNGLQLFNAEVTGIVHDKLRPRIKETAKHLWGIYMALTGILVLLLWLGPMSLFDAVCHAFTALATGGYSTKQASIAHWNSSYIEYVLILFMLIGGINFSLIYYAIKGSFQKLLRNEEVRWLLVVVVVITASITIGLYLSGQEFATLEQTIRTSLFQVASNISTTGFATYDFNVWGDFYAVLMFLIMFFGATAGSTSGGAKMGRFVVIIKNTANDFYHHLHPNAVVPVKVDNKVVSHEIVSKVLSFVFVYVLVLVVSATLLSAMGLSFEEAFGNTLSCISNVGPGFGRQAANFTTVPAAGKWILSFVMLIGRLELFTVLILFSPHYWRK